MQQCHGYFPPLTCTLVEIGERTGRLDEVLLGLAEHYEHLQDLRRTFLIGIAWPAIQFFAAICVVGLLIYVLGMIGSSTSGGEPVDILGFGLVGTEGVLIYMALVIAVLGGLGVFVVAVFRGALGPLPLRVAMRIPVIGSCLKTAALSRLAWTLSLTLDSGIDARRAAQMALQATENAYYTSRMKVVNDAIAEGREFHESLRRTGLFPQEFLDSLESAELSGTHGESLQRLATEYRDRAKGAAKALTMAATFGVWIVVAAILIALIFRLAMFYIGMLYDALEGF
jgi:type II secretory pathway component PulF